MTHKWHLKRPPPSRLSRTGMGGPEAERNAEEGAAGIVWAATLPRRGPRGGGFRDGKRFAW